VKGPIGFHANVSLAWSDGCFFFPAIFAEKLYHTGLIAGYGIDCNPVTGPASLTPETQPPVLLQVSRLM
jgi:hypothetical protein